MIRPISKIYLVVVYYVSWIWFSLVGLALNAGCILLLPLPNRHKRAHHVRATIRLLFDLWVKWLNASKIVGVHFHGFNEPLKPGTVYVANHPTLVDATIVVSRMPDAVCIFKTSLMRNPVIGPAAVMAEYVDGGAGIDVIRDAATKVANGCTLLVFPEGTRTAPGQKPAPFKPGYALIAARAKASVRLLTITASRDLAARGRPWWKLPPVLPGRIDVTLDKEWPYVPDRSPTELNAQIERRLAEILPPPSA
ncbi:MAG: lysophospholipid acyltransferase family protein [Nibricoccus sp.]